jgi:hypothetical protein
MSGADKLRITLEIDRGTEPITGVASASDGQARPFCGWTALATAIEQAIEELPATGPACAPAS